MTTLTDQLMADVHAYGLARAKLGAADNELARLRAKVDSGLYSPQGMESYIATAKGDVEHWVGVVDRYDEIVKASIAVLITEVQEETDRQREQEATEVYAEHLRELIQAQVEEQKTWAEGLRQERADALEFERGRQEALRISSTCRLPYVRSVVEVRTNDRSPNISTRNKGFTQGYVERLAIMEEDAAVAERELADAARRLNASTGTDTTTACACPPSCCCRNQA